ncbi:MAG: hypothetical protein K9M17_05560 [Mariprofundaceae bacterium]|nr:hypothetical protein [Mariprofundaceae bacterium]
MNLLDKLPYPILIGFTILMALAPFVPEPHLLEKLRMLADGSLTKPVDIFDLFWHLLPAILLLLKFLHERKQVGST